MNFPEFITYCQIKGLFSVHKTNANSKVRTASIRTPLDDIALYLRYNFVDGIPVINAGQWYKYSDRTIDLDRSYNITMPEIEKIFFPE